MATSNVLGQTLLSEGSAGNLVSANTFFFWLDALNGGAVDRTDTEPGGPSEGDLYILTGTPTGSNWTGRGADDLALYYNGAWIFLTPGASQEGLSVWVSDENIVYYWSGSEWLDSMSGAMQNLVDDTTPQLGGDLDVNGSAIISASNADIEINPDGTGQVTVNGVPITAGQVYGA